ncbi:MAG: sugar ABC transporter ATP-binding protein [Beutenbergiaceae bacterium]
MEPSYSAVHLTRTFPGITAVAGATFSVDEGTVHGVIGKNGAGKSVMMNMIAGILPPSSGILTILGTEVDARRWNPRVASSLGVELIPQEPPKLPDLTVGDFLFLGNKRLAKRGIVQGSLIRRMTNEIDERLALRVRVSDPMISLPIEVQQLLAFGKAVWLQEARVILLDEITASLSGQRREALLEQLRQLREGRSFTLISHRIAEIKAACDRVTVMRDGHSIDTMQVADVTPEDLAAAIVGDAEVAAPLSVDAMDLGPPVLEIDHLHSLPELHTVELTVHEHEVVGLAGVEGSGKDELLEAIVGIRPSKGTIRIDGVEFTPRSPRVAARRGISFLPKKREEYATIHGMSVLDNMVLPVAGRLSKRFGLWNPPKLRDLGDGMVDRMQVKTTSLGALIDTLSGGNKQKVMMGRLQFMTPRLYALNEPTRGVDISTIPELLRAIRERLTQSGAVLMTSESEEELLQTCDRVLVFYKGAIVREVIRGDDDFTVGTIYRESQGATAA